MVYSKKKTMLLTLSILASLTVPTYAADANTVDKDVVQAPDVVVTATRTEELVKDAPSSVEVITQKDIQKNGATDIYSALRLANNVNISPASTGFGRSIFIRGLSTDKALILVNGHRFANEDTPEAKNTMALERINLSNVERIEIVRGAASAQYGSDALSGVINIITKKSTSSEPKVTVGVNTGTESMNNYYHVDLGKQGNFSGTLDINFGKTRDRALGNGDENTLSGPNQNYSFSGTWDLDKNHSLTFDASYFKSKKTGYWSSMEGSGEGMYAMVNGMVSGMGAGLGMKPDAIKDFVNQEYDKYFSYDLTHAKLNTDQKDFGLTFNGKGDKSNYMIRAYYSRLNKTRFMPYTVMADANYITGQIASDLLHNTIMPNRPEGVAKNYYENNRYSVYGLEANDTVQVADNHLLTYGGEFTKNKIEGDNLGSDGNSKNTNTYAGYIQDEWNISDKLLLIPALRYDHHSDFGSKTTPKLGLTYFINDNNRFKINWGKGFRAPSVTELYSDFYHAGQTILGNPDLKPEESTTWDISYEAENKGTFGKITYFNNKIENMISNGKVLDAANNVTGYYNIDGTTKTHGVEFTLGRQFNDNWSMKLNSNWTSANNDQAGGHDINGLADNVTTLELNYDDNDPYGYSVSLWNQWYQDYYSSTDDKNYTYNTTNFVINKKFGEGNRIYAGLDNIFDKKVSSIVLDGRIWRVGAEWTF